MKLDTLTKYRWVGQLYLPVEVSDGQFEYQFQRNAVFDLVGGMAQTYAYSVEPLDWAAQIINVTNPKGQRPYFVGGKNINMFVTSSSPTFDIYGNLTGYQQVLMRTQPSGWEKAAVAAAPIEDEEEV